MGVPSSMNAAGDVPPGSAMRFAWFKTLWHDTAGVIPDESGRQNNEREWQFEDYQGDERERSD